MSKHTDVMDLLAARRPAYFDDPGDLQRRRSDIERAISAPLSPGFSGRPVSRPGLLHRSRPLTTGLAVAATVALVTCGSAVIFAKKDVDTGPAAATAAHPTGAFLVEDSESHFLVPIKLNGKVFALDEVTTTQHWSPRSREGRGITVETTRNVLADAEARRAWEQAGSPTKVASAVLGKGDTHLTFDQTVSLDAAAKTEVTTNNAIVEFDGCGDLRDCAKFPTEAEAVVRKFNALVDQAFSWDLQTQKNLEKEGSPDDGSPVAHVPEATIRARAVFDTARELLNAPIAPSAKLAIVPLLESTPGIKGIGLAKDQNGRTGTGFTFTVAAKGENTELRLVIERATGQLLAEEERTLSTGNPLHAWRKPTDITQSTVHLGMSWTDADPPKAKIMQYPDGTNDLTWPGR